MIKRRFLLTALVAAMAAPAVTYADDEDGFDFDPIESSAYDEDWDPTAPWIIP